MIYVERERLTQLVMVEEFIASTQHDPEEIKRLQDLEAELRALPIAELRTRSVAASRSLNADCPF